MNGIRFKACDTPIDAHLLLVSQFQLRSNSDSKVYSETVFVIHNILKYVPSTQLNDKVMESFEMGKEAKSRVGKARVALIISVVLVVLLAISNVRFYNTNQSLQNLIGSLETENSDLQKQIGTLQTENTNLQGQIGNLQSQINSLESQYNQLQSQKDTLQSEVDALKTQNDGLQNEIEALKASQLHKVDVHWTDHQRYPSPYVSIQGSIFNSGSDSAYNAILTVRIFDSVGTLLKSEEIHLGKIDGKSYIAFDVDIPYSGDADSVTTTLTYD